MDGRGYKYTAKDADEHPGLLWGRFQDGKPHGDCTHYTPRVGSKEYLEEQMPHLASAEDANEAWQDFVVKQKWNLKPDFVGTYVAGDRKYTTEIAVKIDDMHRRLL